MPTFLAGRELSRHFYEEVVSPLLEKYIPGLPHAAAHLGKGSDVLGFDTEMSRDHDWGPTVFLFLRERDALEITEELPETVAPFFGRPFKVIAGDVFTQALAAQITDPQVQRIASRRLIGNIDQFSDNTDLRAFANWQPTLRKLYG